MLQAIRALFIVLRQRKKHREREWERVFTITRQLLTLLSFCTIESVLFILNGIRFIWSLNFIAYSNSMKISLRSVLVCKKLKYDFTQLILPDWWVVLRGLSIARNKWDVWIVLSDMLATAVSCYRNLFYFVHHNT